MGVGVNYNNQHAHNGSFNMFKAMLFSLPAFACADMYQTFYFTY